MMMAAGWEWARLNGLVSAWGWFWALALGLLLGLAWYADLDTYRGVEATPIYADGVLYNTLPWNITSAYNAATGEVLWTYDPQTPREFGRYACCEPVSRGLANFDTIRIDFFTLNADLGNSGDVTVRLGGIR